MLFTAAVIYICCGFVSGISNFINWTASLAFIPWLFYCFYVLLQEPSLQKTGWFGFVCWLMVVCGYPAFLIYAAYCMLAFFVWWTWGQIKNKELVTIVHALKYFLLAAVFMAKTSRLPIPINARPQTARIRRDSAPLAPKPADTKPWTQKRRSGSTSPVPRPPPRKVTNTAIPDRSSNQNSSQLKSRV